MGLVVKNNSVNSVRESFFLILSLFIIGGAAYLLFVNKIGLYNDDWYLIYDYHTQGIQFFSTVFSGDRPERAYLLGAMFAIFGDNILGFHLVNYVFRVLASVFLYFNLCLVWEKNKPFNFLIAVLFLIYPGFLSQFQPMDFLEKTTSLLFCMVSIFLSLLNIKRHYPRIIQVLIYMFSLFLGWSYLGFVEYFISFEIIRYYFIACLILNSNKKSFKESVKNISLNIAPYLLVAIGFLFWRFFIFHNERDATNLDLQIGFFINSPILTGFRWLKNVLIGMVNVIFSVWIVPIYQTVFHGDLRLRDVFMVIGISIFVTTFIYFCFRLMQRKGVIAFTLSDNNYSKQLLLGGFLISFLGTLPVIIANREIDFNQSRYTLGASIGGLLLLIYFLSKVKDNRVLLSLILTLFTFSIATQLGNELNKVDQTNSLRDFWWQVSWRAPEIQPGTMLIAEYSNYDTVEGYVVWGPANLIYYHDIEIQNPISIQLSAALLDTDTINRITGNASAYSVDNRGIHVDVDFGNILLMTQSSDNACVRIFDGSIPEFSTADSSDIRIVAPYSSIETLIPTAENPIVPTSIFGEEPEHGWCYYYQRASLARQTHDWEQVITLMDEALERGYYPNDRIEWMPLLQAYIATGRTDAMQNFISIMNDYPLYRVETCSILLNTAQEERPSDTGTSTFIQTNFCQ